MKSLFATLQFDNQGLIPAIIVDADNDQVLTLAYMNREALQKSLETGKIHVFRRSKGRLMLKGETSGHLQIIRRVLVDCAGKSLLFKVTQKVAACHEGYRSCYFREYYPSGDIFEIRDQRVFDPSQVY